MTLAEFKESRLRDQEIDRFSSNMSYLVGRYEGLLKALKDELESEEPLNETFLRVNLKNMIARDLEFGNAVWMQRYEKHYRDIEAEMKR